MYFWREKSKESHGNITFYIIILNWKKNPIGEKYGNIANPKFKIKRNLFPNLF